MSISFIVPTIGRESLKKTLQSIELLDGDEIIVVGKIRPTGDDRPRYVICPPGNDWGARERTAAIPLATATHLSFMDDDDVYSEGARATIEKVIEAFPEKPLIFRMRYPSGKILWAEPKFRIANIGTPMMVLPNIPDMLGTWSSRLECDWDFFSSCKWKAEDYIFCGAVIAELGHNV